MTSNIAIKVENVTKSFNVTKRLGKKTIKTKFTALNNVSFEVSAGEVVGIIGSNGSGKSTLLNIINEIMFPDSGRIKVFGKVSSILELGMGFHPDLTGRENIAIKSELYGFSETQINYMMGDIIAYSGLSDFIDNPVRTYSSGMIARLAFSIMVHVDSEIMLVDEVLSVGDALFSSKAISHFKKQSRSGKTILFVSHSIGTIRELCSKVIWLDKGIVQEFGDCQTVCNHYQYKLENDPNILEERANAGDSFALNRLGCMYRDGLGVDRNCTKAYELFNTAASTGDPEALVNCADLITSYNVPDVDVSQAIGMYISASRKGSNLAKTRLSSYYSAERNDILTNIESIYRRLLSNNCESMLFVKYAQFLEKKGSDPNTILDYYQKGSDNDSYACLRIGQYLINGDRVDRDITKGLQWLIKSSDLGNSYASKLLGDLYSEGIYIDKNLELAEYYYKKADSLGDYDSKFQLATLLTHGVGDDKYDYYEKHLIQTFFDDIVYLADSFSLDSSLIFQLFEMAAASGNAWAKMRLGEMYRDGRNSL